jgi:hypothetical protein
MLVNLMIKLFGKGVVDGQLKKWGISKTKVLMVVDIALYAAEAIGPQFGWQINFGEIKEALLAAGLWAARDGMKS